jgi:hypothetical protein
MMRRLLEVYDWVSMGRDILADAGLVAHLLRGLPVAGIVAGYSVGALSGGLIGGSVGILLLALTFSGAVLFAIRRIPVRLSASLAPASAEGGALSAYVESTEGEPREGVASWLSATLTGNVEDDDQGRPYRLTSLRAEMSKMIFGLVPIPVARLDCERFGDAYVTDGVDWLLSESGEERSVRVYFAADSADFSKRWRLKSGEHVRARIVAGFGGANSNLYVQLPGKIEVRHADVRNSLARKLNREGR